MRGSSIGFSEYGSTIEQSLSKNYFSKLTTENRKSYEKNIMNLTDGLKKITQDHKYVDKIASLSPNFRRKNRSTLCAAETSQSQGGDSESKMMYSTLISASKFSHGSLNQPYIPGSIRP